MNIGIILYDGVDEQDFIGPQEVFSCANVIAGKINYEIKRIASTQQVICAAGTKITPECDFQSSPSLEILIVPGGPGSRQKRYDAELQEFIQQSEAEYVLSVCTGSLILAETELLNGLRATTHHKAIQELREYDKIHVVENERYVHDGGIISSAGILSGIDATLYLLELIEPGMSGRVKEFMEYN